MVGRSLAAASQGPALSSPVNSGALPFYEQKSLYSEIVKAIEAPMMSLHVYTFSSHTVSTCDIVRQIATDCRTVLAANIVRRLPYPACPFSLPARLATPDSSNVPVKHLKLD